MGTRSRVSVLLNIWAGDNPAILTHSISSIYSQSRKPDELVVVVDGQISKPLQDSLHGAIRHASVPTFVEVLPNNRGLWFARNVGLSLCTSDMVALHDADDVMHPDRLSIQSKVFEEENLSVLGCPVLEFDTTSFRVVGARKTPVGRQLQYSDFWLTNPIHHSSVMLSRSQVGAVGLYRNLPGVEDLDLWRRLAQVGASVANDSKIVQILGTSNALLRRRRIDRTMFLNELYIAKDSFKVSRPSKKIRTILSLGIRCAYRLTPVPLMRSAQERFLRSDYQGTSQNLEQFLSQPPTDIAASNSF